MRLRVTPEGPRSRVSLAEGCGSAWDHRGVSRPSPARPTSGPSVTGRAFVLGLVGVTMVISLAVPVRAWFGQRASLASLRSEVEAAQKRVADLKVQNQRWNDPSFIAAEARTRLHFVLPGEVGYVALGLPDDVAAAQATQPPPAPWFSSLWSSLRQADDLVTPVG